jgi:hypothetical protein
MSNLRKRVERLERGSGKRLPNLLEFQIRALEQWPEADLQLLVDAGAAQRASRTLAEAELAVLEAYDSAMEKASLKAGFRSIAECAQWYRKT